MENTENQIEVYLEIGHARTFAVVPGWPGWSRGGRDESSALQALIDYAPRYARAIQSAQLQFNPPPDRSALVVIARLAGNATTDFGAPGLPLPPDLDPVSPADLDQLQALLDACWHTFDDAARAAADHDLRKGPRGGGRDLPKIIQHVIDADLSYLASLGARLKLSSETAPQQAIPQIRQPIRTALASSVRGEIPPLGPRGGLRWTPRYFVRRLAWHTLDHAWEIEDRIA